MDKTIAVGEELLDYVAELSAVVLKLTEAQNCARGVKKSLYDENAYTGKAVREMQIFADSLCEHVNKLLMLYGKAVRYIYNTYETMEERDKALAAWLLKQITEGEEK